MKIKCFWCGEHDVSIESVSQADLEDVKKKINQRKRKLKKEVQNDKFRE